nr:Chaperone protein DnaJ 6 [Ipomoea batatas]
MALRLHPDKNPGDEVTEADIEEFEANYRGSDSEKKDLIDLYKKCKGNMSRYPSKGIYHLYVNQMNIFFPDLIWLPSTGSFAVCFAQILNWIHIVLKILLMRQ